MTEEQGNRDPRDQLALQLNKKLYFAELLEKLIKVTWCLKSDDLFTKEDAIPDLIKIIELLELEQQAIMRSINRLTEESDEEICL